MNRRLHCAAFVLVLPALVGSVQLATAASAEDAPPPVAAAAAAISCGTVYGIEREEPHNLYAIDTSTGTTASVGTFSTTDGLNGLAIDGGTGVAWAVQTSPGADVPQIFSLDPAVGTTSTFEGTPSASDTYTYIMGAVNPRDHRYYYGASDNQVLHLFAFDTVTGTPTPGEIGRVNLPDGSNGGDFAFDALGRLYVASGGVLVRVDQDLPATGSAQGPVLPSTTIATHTIQLPPSLAFGSDGYLYLGSATSVSQVNPSSGEIVATQPLASSGIVDFGSCASPGVMSLRKDLPDGRAAEGDEFALEITGGGLSAGNTGTTTGAETGVQDQDPGELAGPVLGLAGTTYRIAESAVGATDMSKYVPSWRCVNTNGQTLLASGRGTTGSFVMPDGGASGSNVVCTFTNRRALPKLALEKRADVDTITHAGEKVSYSFLIANVGNVPVSDVGVRENEFSGSGSMSPVECPEKPQSLEVGEKVTCTATYVATQADLDAGVLTNTAVSTGIGSSGDEVESDESTVEIRAARHGALALEKSAQVVDVDHDGATGAGDRIEWSLVVTNTGNVTVHHVTVSDPTAGPADCPSDTLAPGQSMSCTVRSHVITTAEATAGEVRNTATASAEDPDGTALASDQATAEVHVGGSGTTQLADTGLGRVTMVAGFLGALMVGLGFVLLVALRRLHRAD